MVKERGRQKTDRLQLRRQEFVKRDVRKVGDDSGGRRLGQGEVGKDGKSRVLAKICLPSDWQMSCQGGLLPLVRWVKLEDATRFSSR